jgi:hypothetical protein
MNLAIKAMNTYENLKSYLFNVKYIYGEKDSKWNNIYRKYIITKICKELKNISIFNIISDIVLYFTDEEYELIKLNKFGRNYIISKASPSMICDLKQEKDINELIMQDSRKIIRDIKLDKESIKNMLEKYSDRSEKYDHTLRNIYNAENKNLDINGKIIITYLGKKEIKEFKVGEVLDKHIINFYR